MRDGWRVDSQNPSFYFLFLRSSHQENAQEWELRIFLNGSTLQCTKNINCNFEFTDIIFLMFIEENI